MHPLIGLTRKCSEISGEWEMIYESFVASYHTIHRALEPDLVSSGPGGKFIDLHFSRRITNLRCHVMHPQEIREKILPEEKKKAVGLYQHAHNCPPKDHQTEACTKENGTLCAPATQILKSRIARGQYMSADNFKT